jgi:hypothetical protein
MTEAESKVWKQIQSLFERCRSRSNYLVRNARMFIGEKTMTAKHPHKAAYVMGLMAGISIIWTANLNGQAVQRLLGTTHILMARVISRISMACWARS